MNLTSVPAPDDVTEAWWNATREHRLTVQRCTTCANLQHPPRAVCMGCSSMNNLEQTDVAGTGTVDSYTVVHRAPRPDVPVPYVVARVRLAEGPILLTQLEQSDHWAIGDPVTLAWADLEDGRALPIFLPATQAEANSDALDHTHNREA